MTETAGTRSWRWHAVPLLVLALVAVAALHRMALLGERLYWGDLSLYFVPLFEHIRSSLYAGRLPLWNPLVLCGQPIVGNPQAPVFYPSMAALAVVQAWTFVTANALMHVALALVGAYALAYRFTSDRLGAVVAACSFGLGGYLISRLQFPSMTMAIAYLPWLLLAADRLVTRPGAGSVAAAAAVVALLICAGHGQVAYMALLCATAYVAWQGAIGGRARGCCRALAAYGASVGLGLLASAAHWLPSLQLLALSSRGDLTLAQADRFTLTPGQLVNFVAPTFFGHPASGSYWGPGNLWEPCVYIGLVPFALALWAATSASTRRRAAFWTIVAFVSVVVAMGRQGGLYTVAYILLPGLAAFHDPARFTLITTLALAVLCAIGMAALRGGGVARRYRLALAAVCLIDVAWFASGLNPTLSARAFDHRPRALALAPDPREGRVMSMRREVVWSRYLNYDDFGPESARYAHELTDTLTPNTGMRFGVAEASGYEPVPIQAVTQVEALCRKAVARLDRRAAPLLSLLNARLLLLPYGARCSLSALQPAEARGVSAFRITPTSARAWLVRRTVRVDGQHRALAVLADPAFDPLAVATVSGSPGLRHDERAAGSAMEEAWVVPGAADATTAHFLAHTGDAPAFLVWSAAAYPGWRAVVSGRPARVERTNWALCGVVVPAGTHDVIFRYEPEIVRAAIYSGAAGVFLITALWGWRVGSAVSRRRKASPHGGT